MEIYHKNKDQHDKGLSDEVLKDLLELQRINKIEPKKMDQITDVSSLSVSYTHLTLPTT